MTDDEINDIMYKIFANVSYNIMVCSAVLYKLIKPKQYISVYDFLYFLEKLSLMEKVEVDVSVIYLGKQNIISIIKHTESQEMMLRINNYDFIKKCFKEIKKAESVLTMLNEIDRAMEATGRSNEDGVILKFQTIIEGISQEENSEKVH